MTRDTILAILDVHLSSHKAINGKGEAADTVIAAIAKERALDVVIAEGMVICQNIGSYFLASVGGFGVPFEKVVKHNGEQGSLIFRTKGEK